jgi:bifunctional oligoribonuclease and PAP phosphatase NrnA
MQPAVPQELLAAFESFEKFNLIGHEEPDGDCLSSQLALGSYLRRRGKKTALISPGPFTRWEIQKLSDSFLSHVPEEFTDPATLTIVLDCSTLQRIGYLSKELGESTVAVIDHHASGRSFGSIRYIDSDSPSVSYMVQKIIETSREEPSPEEAELLLFGLATDTGFFRHLVEGSGAVFASAARLTDRGASPKAVHRAMYGGRSLASRMLLGRLLQRTKEHFDGRLLLTYETLEEQKTFGRENRDSDSLYQHLQGVNGCEVVALIRQESPDDCSVGLRSIGTIDVGALAYSFGGGGHAQAAGYPRKGSIEEAAVELNAALRTLLVK